ncbi:MAG: histidine kinase [Tagaea sp. CACIAM 22H2]|nr:histidine kinase [Tagaea sp. CACIAM 22H2]
MTVKIDAFVRDVVPVMPGDPCDSVYARFVEDRDLMAVPVCKHGRVVGLVDRYDFLRQLAHSYGRALFDRKPVAVLMDRAPLVVDREIDILTLQRKVEREHRSALIRGFAITADGIYAGYGDALALLRASLAESAATNARLAAALKSRFLANVSHELRTPLNAIIGFSEIMVGETMGALPARYREYAADIHASGRHLLDLIGDLLDMAKIEAGEMRASAEEFHVELAIGTAVRLVREQAARHGVALTVAIDPDLNPLRADPRHFRQIVLNLLSNAIKFTPRGGRVTLTATRDALGGLVVEVRDTGIGMSDAEREIALRPFGQVASALTRERNGTGLGLPIVKALAELNGANFTLDSAPGEGTAARLRFAREALYSAA